MWRAVDRRRMGMDFQEELEMSEYGGTVRESSEFDAYPSNRSNTDSVVICSDFKGTRIRRTSCFYSIWEVEARTLWDVRTGPADNQVRPHQWRPYGWNILSGT